MLSETLDQYKEKRYQGIEADFFTQSFAEWNKNFAAICEFWRAGLREAVAGAAAVQQETGAVCSYLSISLLLSSVYMGTPQLQIDFFDETWFYGRPFYRHHVPADLFFSRWLAFTRQAEDEWYYRRSALRRTMIRTLYTGTLQQFVFSLACNLKYWLADLDMDEVLQGLVIKVPFHLTMGEYLGAQKPVYALLPEVDLLTSEDDVLSLHRFERKIYRECMIGKRQLQLSRFIDCLFEPASFQHLDLRDTVFQNCRFHHVDFSEIKIAGSTWRNCIFEDCKFRLVTAEAAMDGEFYTPPLLDNCQFKHVQIENCDLQGCILTDCVDYGLEFTDSQLDNSGWLDFGR